MPVVTIETWPMDNERKKDVIKKITDVFIGMGIPKEAVTVIIHEPPMDNWGSGGEVHSEKFRDMKKKQ